MEKQKVINAILKADINDPDWACDIVDNIEDKYARGYLDRVTTELGESLMSDTEDYREALAEAATHSIWGK